MVGDDFPNVVQAVYAGLIMPRKILIITPKFPIPTTGACEQERLAGFLQLQRLGFDIRIISKFFEWQNREEIIKWGNMHNIAVDLLPYEFQRQWSLNPLHWDGAANEYASTETRQSVENIARSYQPDIAWFDYSYLWPLYHLFKAKNIPVITRSINFEATHFLQEDGISLKNLLKFFPKVISELLMIKKSDYIFAITPKEERLYKRLGAANVATLPLRSLPDLLKTTREIRPTDQLHLFFMGASYNVHHNRQAAALLIKEVAPELEKRAPGKFFFHILGKKLPTDLADLCRGNIKEEGFVDNLDAFLREQVDIAVIPSIMGAGMQQKIFEPLVYGIPSVVSPRGLAGYPFKDGEHLLLAETKNEFMEQILKLQDINLRRLLSENALRLSQKIFSQAELDGIVKKGLNNLLHDQ